MTDLSKGTGRSNFKREQIKKRNARPERGERLSRKGQSPLRDDIARIDQGILRLLMQRYNLAAKMSQNGRMPAADEKFLREKWQESVARVSKDADLSSRFFSLLQEISFLPKPLDVDKQSGQPEKNIRSAYVFSAPKKKFDFTLAVPADTESACAWAYMAASSGQALRIEPAPDNSPTRDCMNAFIQMGAALTRDKALLELQAGPAMGQPDRVLYAGESAFNFYLYLAHYLGKASRVKITGGTSLNIADFTQIRHFLPEMGARMVHVVPKSNGLPVRLECSGLLPPAILAEPGLPPQFLEALLLASPFYERPFAIDFQNYPDRERVFSRVLPILEQCAAVFTVDGPAIGVNPSQIQLPPQAEIAMDPQLAAFILLLPAAAGGSANLNGYWPKWPECVWLEKCFAQLSLGLSLTEAGIRLERESALLKVDSQGLSSAIQEADMPWQKALLVSVAVCAALHKADISLPQETLHWAECQDFLRACALEQEDDGSIRALTEAKESRVWNSPSAIWALALAVCACARSEKNPVKLGNPAVVSEIWIPFWNWYGSLIKGEREEIQTPAPEGENKSRRRIRTTVEAVLPEEKEEDY